MLLLWIGVFLFIHFYWFLNNANNPMINALLYAIIPYLFFIHKQLKWQWQWLHYVAIAMFTYANLFMASYFLNDFHSMGLTSFHLINSTLMFSLVFYYAINTYNRLFYKTS